MDTFLGKLRYSRHEMESLRLRVQKVACFILCRHQYDVRMSIVELSRFGPHRD